MEISLFFLFIISCVYCCDMPAWTGFEFLVNNHDSIWYSLGVSIIASYIFYIFQVVIPRIKRLRSTRIIALDRLEKLENTMYNTLCCLQGVPPNPGVKFSMELIKKYLDDIDVFSENSKYEIHQHKELSVFEALVHYDNKIMTIADEIIAGQYLESKYESKLLDVKRSVFHNKIMFWIDNQPGEYKRYNQIGPGYICVNVQAFNSDVVFSLDEYLSIYDNIKKIKLATKKKLKMI